MTEHSKWVLNPTFPPSKQILYVRGYILGIEDALQDLVESEIFQDETFYKYKKKLEDTLVSANRTLNALLLEKK